MSTLSRSEEKLRLEDLQHYDQEDISYCSLGERPDSPGLRHHGVMEQEKRIRREIANSNERRRMQSINAGFQSLRTLLPHHEGEKLSKAAILQQTAEYIYQLEQEKTRLLSQNCQLKRLINQHEGEANSAAKKRKTETGIVVVTEEGVVAEDPGSASPTLLDMDQAATNSELIELRVQLDRERGLRMILEDQVRSLETQLYPERIREITQQVQLQYSQHQQEEEPGMLTPLRRESQSSTASTESQETAGAVATLQVVSAASLQPVSHTETVIATTPSPPHSPSPSRLPSLLEAAIKSEPKAEAERLPSPSGGSASGEEVVPQARVYLASTSRQNLETIVEAIRHLEGDAFISDSAATATAATTDTSTTAAAAALSKQQRLLNPFLQFHPSTPQQRPGVIVVKQHT